MTSGDALLIGCLVVLGVGFALVAVDPKWLDRYVRHNLEKTKERVRLTGERNPYVRSSTNPDGFLRNLRAGALIAAVLCVGLLGWLLLH
jgi:hypothetical protein